MTFDGKGKSKFDKSKMPSRHTTLGPERAQLAAEVLCRHRRLAWRPVWRRIWGSQGHQATIVGRACACQTRRKSGGGGVAAPLFSR